MCIAVEVEKQGDRVEKGEIEETWKWRVKWEREGNGRVERKGSRIVEERERDKGEVEVWSKEGEGMAS